MKEKRRDSKERCLLYTSGGALFVLIYLFFLIALGAPIMTMEFAVGRASQKSAALAFHSLVPLSLIHI